MIGFKIIYYFLFIITGLYGLYFSAVGIIGLLKKNKETEVLSDKQNRFAVLIAARNEEKTIGGLLKSLNMMRYPRDKFSVYVIPNNCTDQTEKIALENGAEVIRCTVPTKTKADVLRFAFSKLKANKEIDAYVVFDADNVVDSNFLYYMNRSLNSGFRVAQGFREAKNPADNWISGSYAIFYLFQNVFFNHTRRKMRLSASINGTGFMIKKKLIDEVGFDTKTLTEDVEFSGLCALRNEKIDFVEGAITYDENPVDFKSSWKQRKRWTAGNLSCMKLYSAKLFGHFIKTRNLSALDLSLRYSAPVVQVVGFANFILLSFFKVIGIELSDIFSRFFALGFLCMVISYFIGLVMEIIILKYKGKSVKPMVSGLLMFAFFVLTWVPINFVCLIKKQTSWEEIKHNRNISIAEIVKNYR